MSVKNETFMELREAQLEVENLLSTNFLKNEMGSN